MLYYTKKHTDLTEYLITKRFSGKNYLQLWFFPEKCDKVHLFKTTKYSEFIPLKLHDCSDTIFGNIRPVLESFSLPIQNAERNEGSGFRK